MKELFEEYYASDGETPSNNDGDSTPEKPADTAGDDDLLG